ncbi:hypothetical protein [Nocardia sp. NPDC052566]|uniref:hypothetical protein n=1 Tax=Nocardia sp. NPDC052566 TaxID=3364330 RepID=UPI0037C57F5C
MATRSVPQPPFSPELLADLHADNVTPEQGKQLWPSVRRDPEALRFLHSLDDVSAELRELGRDERIIHPMPGDVLARLERFVEELDFSEGPTERVATVYQLPSAPSASRRLEFAEEPTVSATVPSRRRHPMRWLAAAAAAVVVSAGVAFAVTALRGNEVSSTAQPTTGTLAPGEELSSAAALSALGRSDVTGPLAGQAALNRCVHATGLDRTVLGSSNWTYRGKDAVLILLTGPSPHKITALIVGTGCTTGDPQILTQTDIG